MLNHLIYKIRSSISIKFLVTFLVVLIIPLLFLTQIFITRLHTILKNKEQNSIMEKVSIAGIQLDRIFSDMDRIAISLILDYRITDILKDASKAPSYEWFTSYKSFNSLLELLNSNADYQYGITVISHDGKLYHSGASYNALLNADSPILAFITGKNGNAAIFNRALEGFDDNRVITLGRSVYEKGNYLGTILVEVPVSILDKIMNPFEDQSTQIYVLEGNERILYSSAEVDQPEIPEELKEAIEKRDTSVKLDGTSYLFSQLPMDQKNLSVVSLVTADSVFRESSRVIRNFITAFFALITAAIVGISLLTSFFTKDIKKLNAEVSRFGNEAGSDIELPVRSCDEVGQLTEGVIFMSRRINRLLRQVQENERNKRILEFNSLQSQVNPHMIYNTLNTITYLAEIQNAENIREVSSSFAYLLRSLSNQGEFITIGQELEYVRSFIAIKKYNLLCDIQTEYQVEPETQNCRILKLILQPIVENAIIHGFSDRMEEGLIVISVQRINGMIEIAVSDNGIGMDEELVQSVLNGQEKYRNTFLRVGVKNIIDRLKLQYGDRTSFLINSAPGCGTTVHISFPEERMIENTGGVNIP
ncbi:MAG TPA: histidine kinase [Candidatus Eisenbergiella intestinipullorum]|nr:histidine kinase [Candidatus Eisenbergiella intestinipullorum]